MTQDDAYVDITSSKGDIAAEICELVYLFLWPVT